ncbi:MAG TPA: FAD-dependent oxidoreductase, partial [Thermoanaerobaculia bacterium]
VPTKALVASAKLAHSMRNAARWGLPPFDPQISPRAVMDSMREAQQITAHHDDPEKFRRLGVTVIEGDATLLSTSEVRVGERTLKAKDIVIATGSRTAVPPVPGLEQSGFIDHVSFLRRDRFPSSVVILGGGYIGIEFAQILRRFGSRVTIVEMLDSILAREDADVIATIRRTLEAEGIDIRTGWKVAEVNGKSVTIENAGGTRERIDVEEIFVASGRRGNVEDLGLENAGVQTKRSYIEVDSHLRTTAPRIWAAGDVTGSLQFTHVAGYHGVKLVRNILFPGSSAVDYDNVPVALYTDPEVARVGMTEAEAREKHGEDVKAYSVQMADVDRAVVDRTTAGFVKLIVARGGRIAGAQIVASNASALIAEIVVARKKRMTIGDLAQVISPYPSLADAIQKAAALHYQALAAGWPGAFGRRVAAWSQ